jgi:Alginate export
MEGRAPPQCGARASEQRRRPRAWVGVALVALAASGGAAQTLPGSLTLSGELRVRGEFDRRTAGVAPDAAALLRSRVGLLATLDSATGTRVFVQFSDSRAFGQESNTLTDASANQFDLHQGYLEGAAGRSLRLRAGRQELAFADERLIGAVDWANVSRAFDGVRATWRRAAWTVDGFAAVLAAHDALLATGLDPRRNVGTGADGALVGAWVSGGAVDLFALGEGNTRDGARLVRGRYTVGGYLRRRLARWRVTGMGAFQGGRQLPDGGSRQDIAAYLASVAVSYDWTGRAAGALTAQADYLSGDRTPADARYTAFNTLYGTNHAFYGSMDLFLKPEDTGLLGLIDLMGRLSLARARWLLRADAHRFELAQRAPGGARAVGQELDLLAARRTAQFGLQAGYSVFAPAAAARQPAVGLGSEVLHWAYLQVTGRF